MTLDGGPASGGESGSDPASRPPPVAVENLVKEYGSGDDAVRAVNGVSFEVAAGTAVGLLGPNGAGKTTTIKSLLGLVEPTAGTARVRGVDVRAEPRRAYAHVGAMLEGARNVYWRLTVRENLRFFAALAGSRAGVRERQREQLERFGLADRADTPVRELSRGQKQKVSLACTLARDADVLFLDEPTLGLDVESSLELRRELRRLVDDGVTVVLSSHDMDVIEAVCDRVVIVSDGEVVVDDAVDGLLDAFHTQTYEVGVEGTIPAATRDRLRATFDADGFEDRGGRERFVAQVRSDEFYDLVDALRDAGLAVVAVNVAEPDLEEVFLEVTEDADAEVADADGSGGGVA